MQLYITLLDERFSDRKRQTKMFLLFSMQTSRKQVYDIASAESFGEKLEEMLSSFWCEKVFLTTQYPESKGGVFTVQPYRSLETFLIDEMIHLSTFLWQKLRNRETLAH